jgi:antitoxin VapB
MKTANKDQSLSDKNSVPLERLKGSVKKYERPTEPVWDEYFDGEGVTDDFMTHRDQPKSEEPD